MFKEQYRKDNERLHARAELLDGIKARAAAEAAREKQRAAMRRNIVRYGAMAAAFLLVFVGAFSAGRAFGVKGDAMEALPMTASAQAAPEAAAYGARTIGAPMAEEAADEIGGAPLLLTSVDSYDELYALIAENRGGIVAGGGPMLTGAAPVAEEAAAEAPAAEAPAAEAPAADKVAASVTQEAAIDGDYSETNVQVAGVDEADIVKTDGKNLYYIAGDTLVIAAAAGENTKVLSTVRLLPEEKTDTYFYSAREMYLAEDRLIVLLAGDAMLWRGEREGWRELTCMASYDISDPSNPKLIDRVGQTGSYVSSRMTGGRIYLVTQQYQGAPVQAVPLSFVPALWTDGAAEPIAVEGIRIPDRRTTHAYTVIGSFDVKAPAEDRNLTALLGHAGTVYATADRLLLAQDVSEFVQGQVEPNADYEGKNVCINRHESRTRLSLYSLGEIPVFLAEGEVRGTLLNQFSMDIHGDTVRVVTTVNDWQEIIFTDGIDTYEWKDETFNCLYTLSADLDPLGALENLAENEWVESVRFDGDIAYFVTFRQTDPLFTVDLADPANPKLLSTLKIPGFSEYLHGFGAGRLLGIGYDADPETGWRQGVKLTMFDTSNKADVKELHTKILSADDTPVGSNHKAILVDVSRSLIAFPADDCYYVFAYDEGEGFTQRGKLQAGHWGWDLRGVRIGEDLYICSASAITVISLEDCSVIARAAYPEKTK